MRSITARLGIPLLCAVALVTAPACTTTRTIDPQSQPPTMAEIKRGDRVKLTLTDGRALEMTLVDRTPENLTGSDRNGVEHTIALRDISVLQVTRASTGKTLLLVGGIALLVALLSVKETVDGIACALNDPC